MLAGILEGPGRMEVRKIKTPTPKKKEVLVKVKACSICKTDYLAFTGERLNCSPSIIMGHEFSGEIAAVGEEIDGFSIGDAVIVSPLVFCGNCDSCKKGLYNYCQRGATIGGEGFDRVMDGAFAEYVIVPEQCLFRKPENVSFMSGALAEPLAGAYKGLVEFSEMKVGEDLVVIGSGGVGLLLAQIAKIAGAATLILVDIEDHRLQYAKKCGATHMINCQKTDARKKIYEIIPTGPDIIIEAAGALSAVELTMNLCREGTRVNILGVITPGDVTISPGKIHLQETRIDASFGLTPQAMLKAIKLMEKGLVKPQDIISHEFALRDIQKAFQKMGEPERAKIIIRPDLK